MDPTAADVAALTPMALWSLWRLPPGCVVGPSDMRQLAVSSGDMVEMEAAGLAVRDCGEWWRPTRAAERLIREHRAVEARKRVEGKRRAREGRHVPATARARWQGAE